MSSSDERRTQCRTHGGARGVHENGSGPCEWVPAGPPQPSHVTLRIEYDDGQVHEFSVDSPREVKLDVAYPLGAFAMAENALRECPYMIPKVMDRTRHVEISLDADLTEQVWIRDSRVTIAARRALDAFRLATGWSDERAMALAEAAKSRMVSLPPTPG